MPIFEYVCKACDHRFEVLLRAEAQPQCPACRGQELEKQFSVFAVGASAGSTSLPVGAGACGTCGDPRGPGACSIN